MTKRTLEEPKLRQSISFTKEQHAAIAEIAEKYNVSFCWVVRHACDLLVQETNTNRLPLISISTELQKEQ